jgi:hypothetical protein
MSVVRKAAPTPGDLHVNAMLTNLSVAYKQTASQYVAGRVFPALGVQKQSDNFYKWTKKTFLSAFAKVRAPGTETVGGTLALTTDSYACETFGYHYDISDPQRANADNQLSLEDAAQEMVMGAMLREQERIWLANFFKTGVWGTDITGVDSAPGGGQFLRWNVANSNPAADIETGKTAILASTGKLPNQLTVGRRVYAALRNNSAVKDQFKYTSADSISPAMLARYFDIEELLVSDAIVTTDAGATFDLMAGKHALLTYTDRGPGLNKVTAGITFAWSGYTGAVEGVRMKKYRMEPIASDRIEGEYAYQQKLVAADLGYFLYTAVA